MTLISFSSNRLTSLRTQNLIEPPVIPTTKQTRNSDIKKHDFDTDSLFMQRLRDKPEHTNFSIIIVYILKGNKQLLLRLVHTKLSYLLLLGPILIQPN